MNNRLSAVVVNDSASMRQYVSSLLQERLDVGVILEAESADDAVRLIRANKTLALGCVFSDLEMPGMNANNFLAFLRDNPETAHVPCVLLADRTQKVAETIALRDGFTDYLSKPFSPELFIETISRIWTGHERRRACRVWPSTHCDMELGFDDTRVHQVELRNISMTGCLVRVPASIEPAGHVYDIGAMRLSLDTGDVVKLYGNIVRVEADYDWQDCASVLVAFNFTALDEESRGKLGDYIESCDKAIHEQPDLC